jgi:hypothetical protein
MLAFAEHVEIGIAPLPKRQRSVALSIALSGSCSSAACDSGGGRAVSTPAWLPKGSPSLVPLPGDEIAPASQHNPRLQSRNDFLPVPGSQEIDFGAWPIPEKAAGDNGNSNEMPVATSVKSSQAFGRAASF